MVSELESCYGLTTELVEKTRDMTAIVGLDDKMAFGIRKALQKEKIRVPAEMSVMGCDKTLFARIHKVALTTIDHFVVYKGRDACDIIMKKIDSRDTQYADLEPVSSYHVEYEPRLIVRGTTGYPSGRKRK